jgi:hypothetical protein
MLLRYFLNNFEMVPVAPIITGVIFDFMLHMRCISIVMSSYFENLFGFFLYTTLSVVKTTVDEVLQASKFSITIGSGPSIKRDYFRANRPRSENTKLPVAPVLSCFMGRGSFPSMLRR